MIYTVTAIICAIVVLPFLFFEISATVDMAKEHKERKGGLVIALLLLLVYVFFVDKIENGQQYIPSIIFFFSYAVASVQDSFEKKAYHIYNMAPFVISVVYLLIYIIGWFMDKNLIHCLNMAGIDKAEILFAVIPLVFVILTKKTRGSCDTWFMVNLWLIYMYRDISYMDYYLIALFLGYFFQFIYRMYYAKKNDLKFKDNFRLAFLPSLFMGFIVMEVYDLCTTYLYNKEVLSVMMR